MEIITVSTLNTQQKDNHGLKFHTYENVLLFTLTSIFLLIYLQIMSILRHQHRPHFRSVV